jgi:hypothetical protein
MEHDRGIPEPPAQASREDGRQADFGHQPDRAASRRERFADRAQIDFRLPASRHAEQEEGSEGTGGGGLAESRERSLLVRGERKRRSDAGRRGYGAAVVRPPFPLDARDCPAIHEPPQERGRESRRPQLFARGGARHCREELERRAALRRTAGAPVELSRREDRMEDRLGGRLRRAAVRR